MKNNIIESIKKLSIHDHVCFLYQNKSEQFDIIIPFITIGLENNEKCIYLYDDNNKEDILKEFRNRSIKIDDAIKNGKFMLTNKNETYLKHGYFSPEDMLQFLKDTTHSTKKEGFSALRIAGEMTWIGNHPKIKDLMEYESKVNNIFLELDITAICQFNINILNPEITMGIINTHPIVIYENLICENFYYIPPDKFLESKETINIANLFLENIQKIGLAKKKLEDSENKYRTIVETSYEGISIIDTSMIITFANSRMAQMLGHTPEEMIGRDICNFMDKDSCTCAIKYIERRKEGINYTRDFKFSKKDGSDFWAIVSTNPLFDNIGQYIGVLAMVTDITERKQIENRLRKSEISLKSAQELGKIGSWEFDLKTQKINWSDEVYVLYERDKSLGPPSIEEEEKYYPPEEAKKLHELALSAIETGKENRYDTIAILPSGRKVYFDSSINPIKDEKGNVIQLWGTVQDITERKQIENKLRKSEDNLKRAQRVAHIGNWEWDILTGKIIWSEETFRLHGIGPNQQEPSYKELIKYYHPEDIPNFERVVENTIKNGTPYKVVCRTTHPDGSTHYLEGRGEATRDNKGDIVKLFGTSMDITEHVHTRSLLNETQKITKVGGWEYDIEKKLITWTDETYNIYGVSKDYDPSNIDNNIEFFSPEDRPIMKNAFDNCVNNGKPYDLELKFITAKGQLLWVRTIGKPILHKEKVVRVMGNLMDITEQKLTEQTLRLHEEITKNMSEGVYLIRLNDLKIVYTNPKFETMFGYNQREMIGKDVSIVNAPTEKDPEVTAKEITTIIEKTGEWYGEIKNIKKDGTHFWCYAGCSLFDHAEYGKVIIAIHTDITKRKIAEEKLNKAYKDLERSNKELEQFAYISSHDLQEPLRTIYGYAELLESNYKGRLDTDADEFIEYITTGAKRMQQMINDLLALSRISTRGKEFVPVNIERILRIVTQNLQSLIDKNQAIITYDPVPTITADDSQMIQLFQNLIDNAIKFRREEIPKVHISCMRKNEEWLFSVKDNGIGIDKNQFKKLFIIFQRLHSREEYPGTGIGLAICKKIVERHGGRIWLESDIRVGSTFYFAIPIKLESNNN